MIPFRSFPWFRPARPIGGILLAFCLSSSARAGLFEQMFPHDIDVVTVTDVTPAGRLLTPGSPARPVYYEAINVGYFDWGIKVAGDQLPSEKQMLDTIVRTLAANGYRPANREHKPTLLLVLAWGTLRQNGGPLASRAPALQFLGGAKLDLMWDAGQEFSWVDARVLLRGFRSSDAEKIMAASNDPLYIALVRAYDFQAVNQSRKVLLWETRMGCPAPGLQCDLVLPQLIKAAGPVFGRETARPVWVNASDKFKANVELGEAKVVEYLDSSGARIIDLKSLPPAAKSGQQASNPPAPHDKP